ncbi:hypothetical protein MiSe_64010 [Microseira wollei NIES-4236]|uniref:Transposase n=1 Tax=Microseira wollei NIES-4236 TaxID=2530354 RepID=A0AAV3WL57_9CYAN|nr:hypothetical protein MiSe_64010 [Microseira wollei NIES-4236]
MSGCIGSCTSGRVYLSFVSRGGFNHRTYARAFLSPKFQAAISGDKATIFQRNFGVCVSPEPNISWFHGLIGKTRPYNKTLVKPATNLRRDKMASLEGERGIWEKGKGDLGDLGKGDLGKREKGDLGKRGKGGKAKRGKAKAKVCPCFHHRLFSPLFPFVFPVALFPPLSPFPKSPNPQIPLPPFPKSPF